jgi:STE24 endopeptidase
VAAALLAAEGAVLLLRPRDGIIDPAPAGASSYFSPSELERGRAFRRPQRRLALAAAAIETAVLARLVRRPPAAPAALTGAALSLALTAAPLPVRAIARRRAVRAGLVTQSWAGWGSDLAKSAALGSAFAAAGAELAARGMRRWPATWWLPGSGVVVAAAGGMLFAAPVLLDPIFNRFEPLPEGETRSDVLELAQQAGVRVREVYVVDASRRTTLINAYVTGLGPTKRVVLYDTLLDGFTRDEIRLVVAHELAHVRYRDVPRGVAFVALVAPLGMLAVARVAARLGGSLPALALAGGLVGTPIGWVANGLSRRIERRADSFSLELTGAPGAFISFERGIALRNLADVEPPRMVTALLATHPPTMERIGIARAYEAARP